ncbi:hypothetical protein K4L44_09545 [Halosquirtibacter laminarini]|uniref:Uncharacterized protein n=1 Tax=Halosquirtibacter laminarini TaxID=3374600 RepID=A0AC61NBI2_9BACT|nr:hypothetical protein K4L44_09545 [Prolixibacteraceae bacterium]
MKKILYLLTFLTLWGCSTSDESPYNFATYHAEKSMDYKLEETYKMLSQPESYDLASYFVDGDLMLIGNRSKSSYGVDVQNIKTGEVLHHFYSWETKDSRDTIKSLVSDMAMNEKYIFLLQNTSKIDVFSKTGYQYVTTIGTGKWNFTNKGLIAGNGLFLHNDQLFVRDREKISVFNVGSLEDVAPGELAWVAFSATLPQNNYIVQFASYKGRIFFTDVVNKCLYSFEDKVYHQGEKIVIDKRIDLDVEPWGICLVDGDIVISAKNDKFYQLVDASGNIEEFKVEGYSNRDLGRLFCDEHWFWFSDTSRNYISKCSYQEKEPVVETPTEENQQ